MKKYTIPVLITFLLPLTPLLVVGSEVVFSHDHDPDPAATAATVISPASGYFFTACDKTASRDNLGGVSDYLAEIGTSSAKVLGEPLCSYKYRSKASDNGWAVALVPFSVLDYYSDNNIKYTVIAQIDGDTNTNTEKNKYNNGYDSYLIVNKDSAINSLAGLDGKAVLASSPDSLSTAVYPMLILDGYFKKHNISLVYNKSEYNELSELDSHKVSAAFVNNYIVGKNLTDYRVLMSFHNMPDYLAVVNNKLVSKSQAETLEKDLLSYQARDGYIFTSPDYKLIASFRSAISNSK